MKPFFITIFIICLISNLFSMDFTKLKDKTSESTSGGGYFGIRIALPEHLDAIPLPNPDNPAETIDDFIFKAGKDWIPIYAEDTEYEINEEPSDQIGSDAYTSTLKGFLPGENAAIRQFTNSGHASKKLYALIDNCEDMSSFLFGKGICCPASLKLTFKGGKKPSDPKGFEFVIKTEGKGFITKYKGVGAINKVFQIPVNETTPDVSRGTGTYLIPANPSPTSITTLLNAVIGSLVTFKWSSAMNPSVIADGVVFHLTDNFTPVPGATLTLQVLKADEFSERHRYIPV
jgi:hypothetical protein